MVDELWDRQHRGGREQLHAGFDRLAAKIGCSIGTVFRVAHAINFDAPWAPRSKEVGCA